MQLVPPRRQAAKRTRAAPFGRPGWRLVCVLDGLAPEQPWALPSGRIFYPKLAPKGSLRVLRQRGCRRSVFGTSRQQHFGRFRSEADIDSAVSLKRIYEYTP